MEVEGEVGGVIGLLPQIHPKTLHCCLAACPNFYQNVCWYYPKLVLLVPKALSHTKGQQTFFCKVKVKVKVTQSCLTLCDPIWNNLWNSPPRILDWVAIPFSSGSSQPRDWTQVSCIAGDSLPAEPWRKPNSKCFRLCRLWDHCHNYSSLPL